MRIETLFDAGSAAYAEDRHVVRLPFCAVADGVSAPYGSRAPLRVVDGHSGGAIIADVICQTIAHASVAATPKRILQEANGLVAALQKDKWKQPLDRPDLLAGASVALVRLGETIDIATLADPIVAWRFRDGTVDGLPNTMYEYESDALQRFARILREAGGNIGEAWERYYEPRCAAVRAHTNKPGPGNFTVLNGQDAVDGLIRSHRIPREGLCELIIATDGLVPFGLTVSARWMAAYVFDQFDLGRLDGILSATRRENQREGNSSHASCAEATAIVVTL